MLDPDAPQQVRRAARRPSEWMIRRHPAMVRTREETPIVSAKPTSKRFLGGMDYVVWASSKRDESGRPRNYFRGAFHGSSAEGRLMGVLEVPPRAIRKCSSSELWARLECPNQTAASISFSATGYQSGGECVSGNSASADL